MAVAVVLLIFFQKKKKKQNRKALKYFVVSQYRYSPPRKARQPITKSPMRSLLLYYTTLT